MPILSNDTALSFLAEVCLGIAATELDAILTANAHSDSALAYEQYALVAALTEAADPRGAPPLIAAAAALEDVASPLLFEAQDCVDRMLKAPHALIWAWHTDGGLQARREARALRARLHRVRARDQ